MPHKDVVEANAKIVGVCRRSVYRVRKENILKRKVSSPKRTKFRQKISDKIDDFYMKCHKANNSFFFLFLIEMNFLRSMKY